MAKKIWLTNRGNVQRLRERSVARQNLEGDGMFDFKHMSTGFDAPVNFSWYIVFGVFII